MPTRVLLTIDTELMWRHHVAGLDAATVVQRSLEPAGVGVGYQLEQFARFGLKTCFFVDPMPALIYGIEPIRRVVGAILEAGQEVQLHCHPNWTGMADLNSHTSSASFELASYDLKAQRYLLQEAMRLLIDAGAPRPVAFRSGSYSANDDTLTALAQLGFAYDSSHNGSEHPWPSGIDLPPRQIAPLTHRGVVEVPVTVIEDRSGNLRHFQICALSAKEMQAALDHAEANRHGVVTIVSHGFELANRPGTRPNKVHLRRFEALCRMLADRAEALPTAHFADRPALALGQNDQPLGPNILRTRMRQAEQLWSNLVAERAA